MITLDKLPLDMLRPIFAALANVIMLSLITSRRECRALQLIVTEILNKSLTDHGAAMQTLFMSRFRTIFDSSKASHEFRPIAAYTLGHAPFYSLPWASDSDTRAKYLCEKAS